MIAVEFCDAVADEKLKFAVIVARHGGRWAFCKHRECETYECPGGRREAGESIEAAARRELWEETGANEYALKKICVYGVRQEGGAEASYGMLYYATIFSLGALPDSEIEKVELFDSLSDRWTYPQIQPKLVQKAMEAAR